MKPATTHISGSPSEAELQHRRTEIRRGLARANTAAVITLLIVVALALAAVWQARLAWESAEAEEAVRLVAQRNEGLAAVATRRAEQELWHSRLIESRLHLISGEPGRRNQALEAIARARSIKLSIELRNEALRALDEPDLGRRLTWWEGSDRHLPGPVWDPEFERYAAGDHEGGVSLRKAADQSLLARFSGPKERVRALCFSADGRFLAARFEQGALRVWDLTTSNQVAACAYPATGWPPFSVDFLPDGRVLALASADHILHRLDVVTGQELPPVNLGFAPHAISHSPSGRSIALATGRELRIWSFVRNDWAYRFENPGEIANLAWHPDGRRLAVGSWDSRVYLWDLARSNHLVLAGHKAMVSRVGFHPDGEFLFSTSWDGTTRFWDALRGEPVFSVPKEYAAQFNRDGTKLAYEIENEGFGVREFLNPVGHRLISFPGRELVGFWAADVSRDGRRLVAGGDWGWNIFSLPDGRNIVYQKVARVSALAFSPDGNEIVGCSEEGAMRWPLEPSANSAGIQAGKPESLVPGQKALFNHAALATDRSRLLAWNGEQFAVIDLRERGEPPRLLPQPAAFELACVSPDGRWVAASRAGQTVVIDALSGTVLRTLNGSVSRVCFSPDGRRLLVGAPREVAIWDTGSWEVRSRIPATEAGLNAPLAAYSPEGDVLAVTFDQRRIHLYDARTGGELAALLPRDPQIAGALTFSPDGSQLLAPGSNGIQVWDLTRLRRELTLLHLDWSEVASSAAEPLTPGSEAQAPATAFQGGTGPARMETRRRAAWTPLPREAAAGLTALGVVTAIAFGLYILRYQRGLVRNHAEVEAVVAERNRQLEQAQAELFQSQKMKALGTLAAGIAHDFNNLLSVIRLSNDFLARGVKSDPDLVEEVGAIEQAVQQGKSVVRSMLGYTRRDNAGQPTVVADLVEDTVTLLGQQFLSGIRLTVELDREAPAVPVARSRLEQILLNLVVNAAEAMKGQGHLEVTTRTLTVVPEEGLLRKPAASPRYVELAVADSGPGIPPDVRQRIFEPFFTTKTVGANRGTGLGLSTVYAIAEQDGLGLAVASEPGKGATFCIFIPSAPSPSGPASDLGTGAPDGQ